MSSSHGAMSAVLIMAILLVEPYAVRADDSLRDIEDLQKIQIGPEWSEELITEESLQQEDPVFHRVARSTAYFSGGTSFYLGRVNGEHLMVTNSHVIADSLPKLKDPKFLDDPIAPCLRTEQGDDGTVIHAPKEVGFGLSAYDPKRKTFLCNRVLGIWTDIDLAIFSVLPEDPEDEAWLAGKGLQFSFRRPISQGTALLQIGFGSYIYYDKRNAHWPFLALNASRDEDCKVFSATGAMRLMADPDQLNPGPFDVWSFAFGCDAFWGDSGSAIVDRFSGDVLGVFWSGMVPKGPDLQNPAFLESAFRTQSPAIWNRLNYAVPAVKIREVLSMSDDPTLQALVERDSSASGTVAVWDGQDRPRTVEVGLPAMTAGILANDLVHFRRLPDGIVPDGQGRLVFPITDLRFAYVHTYYYATRAIREYNEILQELGAPAKIRDVGMEIRPMGLNDFPGGSTQSISDDNGTKYWFYLRSPKPVTDVTIAVHEIGHVIDHTISSSVGLEQCPPTRTGIDTKEGIANILMALHLDTSRMGRYDFMDGAIEMDSFVRFPDAVPTEWDMFQKLIASPRFSAAYPGLIEALKQVPRDDPKYQGPDHYQASSIFTQPLWQASRVFGRRPLQKLVLKALMDPASRCRNMDTWADVLLHHADDTPGLRDFIDSAFRERGIWIERDHRARMGTE